MTLSVIIPAYNHLPEVMTALNSLQALSEHPETRYHVQDDASPDVDFRKCVPPMVASTSRNEANQGFAGNCNAGAGAVLESGIRDVLFFVNQDVYATMEWSQGWDFALLRAFADPTVGIVGARLLFPNGSIQSAGGVFDQRGQPMHRCLGWSDPHACDTSSEVEWTTGAALAIRADLFQQLGGFDERYARGYFEDVALCLKARELGYRVRYEPGCTLMHRVGSTGGSPSFLRNALRFKQEFVDSGRVKPGTLQPVNRFW